MKLKSLCLFVALCAIVFSCQNSSDKNETPLKDSVGEHHAIINGDTFEVFNPPVDYGDMELFTNMEQVDYCVPLPLKEYKEDFKQSDVRAKHVFVHNKKKENEILVQGLFRENSSVTIDDYFKNTFSEEETEQQGKIVITKELYKNNNFFYAFGYWNNLIAKSRFVDMYWLRKDDVVHVYALFDIADTSLWKTRLEVFKNAPGVCN